MKWPWPPNITIIVEFTYRVCILILQISHDIDRRTHQQLLDIWHTITKLLCWLMHLQLRKQSYPLISNPLENNLNFMYTFGILYTPSCVNTNWHRLSLIIGDRGNNTILMVFIYIIVVLSHHRLLRIHML